MANFIVNRMEPMEDGNTGDGDTRNVKAVASLRGKRVRTVTKSYNFKAMQKVMYAKEERDKRRFEVKQAAVEVQEKARADAEWSDPVSDKHAKKTKEREDKAGEKTKKKMEKTELYSSEMSNGHSKHGHKKF